MNRVFVDTGGLYAHLVAEDADHVAARSLLVRMGIERRTVITSDAVLFETCALLINRARNGQKLAFGLLGEVEAGGVTLVHVTEDDVTQAIAIVQEQPDKSYSLCDASRFVIIERLGIREAISFDQHFRQYAQFTVLP